ncbi:MAG: PAS domain S-box protein [Planctomycetes bacterium]|nr:PAS domain S-box protein [Planctomycetota bacterium]
MENPPTSYPPEPGPGPQSNGSGLSGPASPGAAQAAQVSGDEHLQQALRQALENLLRYQELFDFAPDGYLVTDLQGLIQEANHEAAAMLGTRKQFLVGKPLLFFVLSPERRTFTANLSQLGLLSGCRLQWELMLRPPRGATLYTIVTAASSPGEERPTSIRWTFRDITHRRQAEEALRAQKEFADSLIELAEAVVLVLDSSGHIVRSNPFFRSLTGQGEKELEGRSLADLLLPENPHFPGPSSRPLPFPRGLHLLRTKDGQTRTIAWSTRALRPSPEGNVWTLFVGQDITDLKEAQRRAVQAERLAAIGEMIAGLAHESRNALQRGQACLELLRLRLQNQPEALDLIERVQKAQDDLHRLYEGVRAYAAPIRLEPHVCDLAQVWREAWEELGPVRANRVAELCEEIHTTERRCEVSPFHLKQVFRNLMENALSLSRGPVRITIRCTPMVIEGRPFLQVAVQDNGPGFEAEQRHKAFQPFFTTKLRGTGLGLAICKRLVEAHGGKIAVGDSPGPGAVILIHLPLPEADHE